MKSQAQPSPTSKARFVTYAISVAGVAAVCWVSLDQPGGLFTNAKGVVQTVGRLAGGEAGPFKVVATIRLTD